MRDHAPLNVGWKIEETNILWWKQSHTCWYCFVLCLCTYGTYVVSYFSNILQLASFAGYVLFDYTQLSARSLSIRLTRTNERVVLIRTKDGGCLCAYRVGQQSVERFNNWAHKTRKNYRVFGYDVVVDWEIGEFWRSFQYYLPWCCSQQFLEEAHNVGNPVSQWR